MVLFLGLEVYHLATGGSVISFGGLILAALSIMAITAVILNQGDRYRIDETGIHYSNPLLARVGIRLDRLGPNIFDRMTPSRSINKLAGIARTLTYV